MSHNFGPYRDYFSGHGSVYSFFFRVSFHWSPGGIFFYATKFRKIAYCDPIKFQSHIHSKREETWRGLELQFQLYKWGSSARFRLFNYLSPGDSLTTQQTILERIICLHEIWFQKIRFVLLVKKCLFMFFSKNLAGENIFRLSWGKERINWNCCAVKDC